MKQFKYILALVALFAVAAFAQKYQPFTYTVTTVDGLETDTTKSTGWVVDPDIQQLTFVADITGGVESTNAVTFSFAAGFRYGTGYVWETIPRWSLSVTPNTNVQTIASGVVVPGRVDAIRIDKVINASAATNTAVVTINQVAFTAQRD